MPAAIHPAERAALAKTVTPGAHQRGAVLRLDVVALPQTVARVTSIIAARQFDVLTMDVTAPADGLRTITVEMSTVDEHKLEQLVKYLNRSLDVVRVVRLLDDRSHIRRGAFITVIVPDGRFSEVLAIARAFSAEVVDSGRSRCTLFVSAEPPRLDALFELLSGFIIRDIVTTAPVRIARLNTRNRARNRAPLDRAGARGQR